MRWLIYVPLFVITAAALQRGVAGWDTNQAVAYQQAGLSVYEWNHLCPSMPYPSPNCISNLRSDPQTTYKFWGGDCPYPATKQCLQAYARSHLGATYSIGNEPENADCWSGDCMTTAQAVEQYGQLIHDIKEVDSGAIIVCCNWVWGHEWSADSILSLYPSFWADSLGSQVAVWSWHVYADFRTSARDDASLIANFTNQLNADATWAAAHNKPLWITEFGVYAAYAPLDRQAQIVRLLPSLCNALRAAHVARAYYFVGKDVTRWGVISAFDGGQLTPTGNALVTC